MADSIQPNPFTIDPAGNVQVVGLDLPAGTSQTPPAQSRVRWIRQSDGAVLAEQLGTEYGVPTPQAQLQQLVYALSGDSAASLEMSAQQSGSPDWFTQLLLLCNPSGQVAKVNAQANDGAGNTHVATIIDSAGESSFLQLGGELAPPRQLAIAAGSTGGVGSGSAIQVTHGLGRQPIAILGSNYWADTTSQADWTFYGATASTFDAVNKGPTTGALFWLAIG